VTTRNYPEDVLAMSADEFDRLVGGSVTDEEEAFEMFDNGDDIETVSKQLHISMDDAVQLYDDWERYNDG